MKRNRIVGLCGLLSLAWTAALPAADSSSAPETFQNSLGMKFVRIQPGSFRMGSETGDFDERPVHPVAITRPLLMGTTEVTNAQFQQFDPEHRRMRGKLGFSKDDDEAVVFVSWLEATAFCRWQIGRAHV